MIVGDFLKIPSSTFSSSTSIFPVEEPIKTFTPAILLGSADFTSSKFSLLAPRKKAKFAAEQFFAIVHFSSIRSMLSVGGETLGISKYVVTPPATAAFDSVSMHAL